MKKNILILLIILLTFPNLYGRWGWGSHRFINDRAVNHLPQTMSFFQDHRDYLSEHSIDPDTDNLPGNYHYIDIDYYPEFFTGTLPHTWQGMIDLYGQNIMEDNGLVPWVIEWWMSDLRALMEAGNWNDVWQIAAELGHYVADSHQALHLTLNYNGQLSNNYGIHSRYETQMINPYLDDISFPIQLQVIGIVLSILFLAISRISTPWLIWLWWQTIVPTLWIQITTVLITQ